MGKIWNEKKVRPAVLQKQISMTKKNGGAGRGPLLVSSGLCYLAVLALAAV